MIAFYIVGDLYEDLEKCPICGLDRFNRRKDCGDDKNRTEEMVSLKWWFGTFLSLRI
jgi:hypothetical protein